MGGLFEILQESFKYCPMHRCQVAHELCKMIDRISKVRPSTCDQILKTVKYLWVQNWSHMLYFVWRKISCLSLFTPGAGRSFWAPRFTIRCSTEDLADFWTLACLWLVLQETFDLNLAMRSVSGLLLSSELFALSIACTGRFILHL